MAKRWVLETSTKGTGANVVPADDEREEPKPDPPREREKLWVHAPTAPRAPKPPEPRRPRRFRVVEITTHQVLADDADARTTIAALRGVPSIVDVTISVWDEKTGRYRLLTHGEQRTLWDLRDAGGAR
jgi:hypothetical protein